MARRARITTLSEVNHIMLRGIGHMNLFFCDDDRQQFLRYLRKYSQECSMTVHAYCLMDNHVHLLLQSQPENYPGFFKKLEVSYAGYFNRVNEHVGYVFQNRYRNEAILDNRQFLIVLRYILYNPQNAGICSWKNYKWSSAQAYRIADDGLTSTGLAFELCTSREEFLRYMDSANSDNGGAIIEPSRIRRAHTESEALSMIKQICCLDCPTELQKMDRKERNELLIKLKLHGITIRQLERLTGINRNIIQRAK